ncbi:MAG: type II toxin-antitoxin system PemK/MazF family toxin [Deltaproteobacteria bacterium]|nr:type II toxin-antitoxin system PemK/MazF family toxin [Deltaproteobacteria bacterium]
MAGRVDIARGDIWTYEFQRPDKRRPVLVLSRPEAIAVLHTVIVAPITSTIRGLPSEVVVGTTEGLKHDSAVSLDHMQTVERARLSRYIGRLSGEKMEAVCRAIAVATGCA